LNTYPDPAFRSTADPDPASLNNKDPDPQHRIKKCAPKEKQIAKTKNVGNAALPSGKGANSSINKVKT
jgi:hypothetical protein